MNIIATLRRMRQKHLEFGASLGYIVKTMSQRKKKKNIALAPSLLPRWLKC
jgi:hypothetical protein